MPLRREFVFPYCACPCTGRSGASLNVRRTASSTAIPTLIPVVTFGTYLFLGNTLTSAEAFTSLALFNVLRFPLFLVPQLLNMLSQVWPNRAQDEFYTAGN